MYETSFEFTTESVILTHLTELLLLCFHSCNADNAKCNHEISKEANIDDRFWINVIDLNQTVLLNQMDIVYILIFYFPSVSSSATRNSHGIQTIVLQKKYKTLNSLVWNKSVSEACVEEYDVINTEFDLYANDIIARQQWKTAQHLLEMSSVQRC